MSVKINIKTTIFHDEGNEIIEAEAYGRFYQKNRASFLQYDEAGEEGRTRTIVKLAGNEALILRSGAINMRLPFVLNRKTSGSYEHPLGKLPITAIAKKIKHSYFTESGKGHIEILYDFSLQEASGAGIYHLEITFQEEEK